MEEKRIEVWVYFKENIKPLVFRVDWDEYNVNTLERYLNKDYPDAEKIVFKKV